MIDKRKIKATMAHRRKKGLCEKCGRSKVDIEHQCFENYISADTSNFTDLQIQDASTEYFEDINKMSKKKIKIKKEKLIEKTEQKIKEKKEQSFDKSGWMKYIVIENLTNYIDFDFLNFMSKYYNNRYYFILLVKKDFINSVTDNMLKINKITNIHIKNIETEEFNVNELLEESKCIFTNNQKIIQCCNEIKHSCIIMPEHVTIETIKKNTKYWEIKE